MNTYKKILQKFPPNILYSFAYGSGVKPQLGYDNNAKRAQMIDFVLCVDNPNEWHKTNLQTNPGHYSSLKYMGNDLISSFQRNYGAEIYYNTLVNLMDLDVQIKYGVISAESLVKDLIDWEYLYIAGRLHKPVTVVSNSTNELINLAIEKNLNSAMRTALLLLPEKFSDYELFFTIANMSYEGDFRMILGENKNKVKNIVSVQLKDFKRLYSPSLAKLSFCISTLSDNGLNRTYQQDKTPSVLLAHMKSFPQNLKTKLLEETKMQGPENDIFNLIVARNVYQNLISKSINYIVLQSSITQSLKNIPSAGVFKSMKYSWRKILKSIQ